MVSDRGGRLKVEMLPEPKKRCRVTVTRIDDALQEGLPTTRDLSDLEHDVENVASAGVARCPSVGRAARRRLMARIGYRCDAQR